MDKLKTYQNIVIDVLNDYKSQFKKTSQNIQNHIISDKENHHYQFLWTGWQGDYHVFNVAFHIQILDGKLWIHQDKTEWGLADWLAKKGIPKSDIVLGYYSEEHRQYTAFAEA